MDDRRETRSVRDEEEREGERGRKIGREEEREREGGETGVINRGRQTFSQTDKLSGTSTDKEEEGRRQGYKDSADTPPCTVLCFSLFF